MPIWFLIGMALAAKPSADGIEREWLALQHLEADTQRYRIITEPIQIQDGPLRITLHSGVLVPIFSGHNPNDRKAKSKNRADAWEQDIQNVDRENRGSREFVGFVFTATDATFQVDFQERAQGLVFATHQVRDLRQPDRNWTDVAHGASWQGFAREGLVLSIDPNVEKQFLGPPDETGFTGDPFDIVVYGEKPRPGALAKAVTVLDERLELMHTVGVFPGRWMAQDRLAESRQLGTSEGAHGVIALNVADELGQLGLPPTQQPRGVHWMNLLRDERGSLNPRMRSVLTTLDRNGLGNPIASEITGDVFERNKDGIPTAPVRIVGDEAQVVLHVVPRAADLEVVFTADIRLRAVGGDFQWFNLNIPRAGNRRQFKINEITIPDGTSVISETPLIRHDPVLRVKPPPKDNVPPSNPCSPGDGKEDRAAPPKPGDFQDDPYLDREESLVTIALPRVLKDGEDVVLHLVWQDIWPWTNMFHNDQGSVSLGSGSGIRSVLPRPEGSGNGNPWRFTFVAMTPADRGLKFALPGVSADVIDKENWRIYQSHSDGHSASFADVSTSNWQHLGTLGTEDRPDIDTYFTSKTDGHQFIQQFRQISNFYEGYLPTFPWKRQVMFQGRGSLNGFVWTAPHAMAQAERSSVLSVSASSSLARAANPSRLLAHEIAHQWWGHLVQFPHREDFWIAESLSEAFACTYMDALEGGCDDMLNEYGDSWENFNSSRTPRASLTQAYSGQPNQPQVVYAYGSYVMQRMLQRRIGHGAYHQALDAIVREHAHRPITTEHLQDFFALTSDQDLTDFFDFWVHAGFIPREVRLIWRYEDGDFVGSLSTDLPFGTFDIQVSIDGERVWGTLNDGRGTIRVPVESEPESVELDPDHLTLTNHRKTTRVDAR